MARIRAERPAAIVQRTIDRSRMATTTTRSAAAAGLLPSRTVASEPSQETSPEFFPLLSLPRDVLSIVIAMAGRDKGPCRLACAQLRDMVDSAVTALSRRYWRQEGLVFTSQLIMRLPRLMRVDISGCRDIGDLSPLAACVNLQYLDCMSTAVGSLAPLATCTSLHTLYCSHTAVSSLAPLALCTSLHTLYCHNTSVSSLAPLASCTALKKLVFSTSLSTDLDFMKNAKIVYGYDYHYIDFS